jgi:hypothetical protein
MKKQILNIGEALTRAEQQTINGGSIYRCGSSVPPDLCIKKCREYTQNNDCARLKRECKVAIKCTNLDDSLA